MTDKIKVKKFKDRTVYYKNGLVHKDNGPAVECNDGTKWWYYKSRFIKKQNPDEKYTVEQFQNDIAVLILQGTI